MKKIMKKKGFTIVELVIVIAAIAILAAVMIPTFITVADKVQASKALQEADATLTNDLIIANAEFANMSKTYGKNGDTYYYVTQKVVATANTDAFVANTYYTMDATTKVLTAAVEDANNAGKLAVGTYYTLGKVIGDAIWEGKINAAGNYEVVKNGYTCIKDLTSGEWTTGKN